MQLSAVQFSRFECHCYKLHERYLICNCMDHFVEYSGIILWGSVLLSQCYLIKELYIHISYVTINVYDALAEFYDEYN